MPLDEALRMLLHLEPEPEPEPEMPAAGPDGGEETESGDKAVSGEEEQLKDLEQAINEIEAVADADGRESEEKSSGIIQRQDDGDHSGR